LSKRKGHRKKRRKPNQPLACPRCHAPADGSPGALLRALASVLNSCADAGLRVRFSHGGVVTREGYVLPLRGERSGWTARTLAYDPLSPAEEPDGDEDD